MASFWDSLTGKAGSEAANAAAADQYGKQIRAAEGATGAGKEYLSGLMGISQNYNPYVQGGGKAQGAVYDLLGLNGQPAQTGAFSNFRNDPGYDYQVQQGLKAVDNSAASRGMLNSGATLKALQDRGSNLADQSYGNYLQRLMSLGTQGLAATGAQTGVQQQGYTGNLQAGLQGAQMQYGAAPTIGQGQIAGANAEAAGTQNLLNAGLNLGGKLMGGFGSSFGGGSGGQAAGYNWNGTGFFA